MGLREWDLSPLEISLSHTLQAISYIAPVIIYNGLKFIFYQQNITIAYNLVHLMYLQIHTWSVSRISNGKHCVCTYFSHVISVHSFLAWGGTFIKNNCLLPHLLLSWDIFYCLLANMYHIRTWKVCVLIKQHKQNRKFCLFVRINCCLEPNLS